MNTILLINSNWSEASDLTVYEAAYWMQIGDDPHEHGFRYAQDEMYATYYDDNPHKAQAVEKKCEVIIGAIRAKSLSITLEALHSNQMIDVMHTRILKTDWLEFCRQNGYADLVNQFTLVKNRSTAEASENEEQSGAMLADELELSTLFDGVPYTVLEKMFSSNGKWKNLAERANRNGLKAAAKMERAMFNPLLAGKWWLTNQKPVGWDWARCCRTLASNLPPRSAHLKNLLTDKLD